MQKVLRAVEKNNGFEAWRLACKEDESQLGQRQLFLLGELMVPTFCPEALMEDPLQWETRMADFERSGGIFEDEKMRLYCEEHRKNFSDT